MIQTKNNEILELYDSRFGDDTQWHKREPLPKPNEWSLIQLSAKKNRPKEIRISPNAYRQAFRLFAEYDRSRSDLESIENRFDEIGNDIDDEIDPAKYGAITKALLDLFKDLRIERPVIGLASDGRLVLEWGENPKAVLAVYPSSKFSIVCIADDAVVVEAKGRDFQTTPSAYHFLKVFITEYGCYGKQRQTDSQRRRFSQILQTKVL